MIKDGIYESKYDWNMPETYTLIVHKGHFRSMTEKTWGIVVQHRGGDFLKFIRDLTDIEKRMFERIEELDPFDPKTF